MQERLPPLLLYLKLFEYLCSPASARLRLVFRFPNQRLEEQRHAIAVKVEKQAEHFSNPDLFSTRPRGPPTSALHARGLKS